MHFWNEDLGKFVPFLYKTKCHFLAKVTKIRISVSLYGMVIRHSPLYGL